MKVMVIFILLNSLIILISLEQHDVFILSSKCQFSVTVIEILFVLFFSPSKFQSNVVTLTIIRPCQVKSWDKRVQTPGMSPPRAVMDLLSLQGDHAKMSNSLEIFLYTCTMVIFEFQDTTSTHY